MDISKIDKNFAINTNIEREDLRFYNADDEPFEIYGIFRENGRYCRMPEEVAKTVSEGVATLYLNTAGGRLRFRTDSAYVAIHAEMDHFHVSPHFAFTGMAGFDLYADGKYVKSFVPPVAMTEGYDSIIDLGTAEVREITLNFPLYAGVKKLYIGLQQTAKVEAPAPYRNSLPVVYYGSSVTQGGCASRPGRCYQSILERQLGVDYVNLGFSGNAKGEPEMGEYIKGLPMSVFVFDYDYNSRTTEHLQNTHERMFLQIREAYPDLPIILMNRPKYFLNEKEKGNRAVIEATYQNALDRGDKNVYFINNEQLTALCGNEGTVDGTHPTDFGFVSMAEALYPVLKEIIDGLS